MAFFSRVKKKIIGMACLLGVAMIPALNADAREMESYTQVEHAAVETVASINAIKWEYKIENGKLYRRWYNTDTGEYGEWIYIRDI